MGKQGECMADFLVYIVDVNCHNWECQLTISYSNCHGFIHNLVATMIQGGQGFDFRACFYVFFHLRRYGHLRI